MGHPPTLDTGPVSEYGVTFLPRYYEMEVSANLGQVLVYGAIRVFYGM